MPNMIIKKLTQIKKVIINLKNSFLLLRKTKNKKGIKVRKIKNPLSNDQKKVKTLKKHIEKSEKLTRLSPLDIYADENSKNVNDINKIKNSFDGINIKLMKCGSIEEALEMVTIARKYNLKIMLGCMVETSVGITAAAGISSVVDKVDLDGNLLIKNDPFEGVKVVNGQLSIPNSNGLGLKLISKNNNLL